MCSDTQTNVIIAGRNKEEEVKGGRGGEVCRDTNRAPISGTNVADPHLIG